VTTKGIGICCPYSAQVAAHNRVKRARGGEFSDIIVGTVEFWHGNEAWIMTSDAVRAEDDMGTLGFFSKSERLNVWMSRCQHAQIFVGDTLCVNPPPNIGGVGGKGGEDKASKRLESQNKHVIAVFKWLESKGQIARISIENITKSDVDYDEPKNEIAAVGNATGENAAGENAACEWTADAAGGNAVNGNAADKKAAGEWAADAAGGNAADKTATSENAASE